MSESKELPNPPGGEITCEDGQVCLVIADEDGIHASCNTVTPPPGGGPDDRGVNPFTLLQLGDVDGALILNKIVKSHNGIASVNVKKRWISLYVINIGLQLVTGVDRPLGGLDVEHAIIVAGEEFFERPNGQRVWFHFPAIRKGTEEERAFIVR